MVVQTFYNGVTEPMRSMIDTAVGGTLMSKTEEAAFNLIEEMGLDKYQRSSEHGQLKRARSKFDVDALTLLTKKMDVMTQKLGRLNVSAVNSCAPSPTCDRCGFHGHVIENCQNRNPFVTSPSAHVASMNNFQPRLTHDSYSNSYNPSWK